MYWFNTQEYLCLCFSVSLKNIFWHNIWKCSEYLIISNIRLNELAYTSLISMFNEATYRGILLTSPGKVNDYVPHI